MFLSLCLPVSCYVSLPFSPPGNSNSAREGGRERGVRDEGMTYNDAGRVGEEKENRTARAQTPSCHIPGIFSFSPFFFDRFTGVSSKEEESRDWNHQNL